MKAYELRDLIIKNIKFSVCIQISIRDIGLDIAQSVGARPSELEDRQFDPRHSIDVCFYFPLFRVAVALNTRKGSIDGGRGVRGAHRRPQVYQSSCTVTCYPRKIRTFTIIILTMIA